MTTQKLEKDIIIKRIDGIEAELAELKKLGQQNLNQFQSGDGWKLAQFHLHRALEGVFNIGSHIISRIPGASASQYKEIALKLGENKLGDFNIFLSAIKQVLTAPEKFNLEIE